METFDTLPQLGRFSLRDEGKTIAIGKVTKIISWSVCWTYDVQNGGSLTRVLPYYSSMKQTRLFNPTRSVR